MPSGCALVVSTAGTGGSRSGDVQPASMTTHIAKTIRGRTDELFLEIPTSERRLMHSLLSDCADEQSCFVTPFRCYGGCWSAQIETLVQMRRTRRKVPDCA